MKIDIYQIYYKHEQLKHLDFPFIPFNNEGMKYPENFEYAVFFKVYEKTNWHETDLLGTVSWKFKSKTSKTAADFYKFIQENPGYDVYFVNPFPELSLYENVWKQGDYYHKNLTSITSRLLKQCGYSEQFLKIETPPNLTAYCNYWVANKEFWDQYMEFIRPLWISIANDKEVELSADPNIKAPYAPFIFERLFSTFLATKKFNVASMPIAQNHRKAYLHIPFLWKAIARIASSTSHSQVSIIDQVLVWAFIKVSALLNYQFPLKLKQVFPHRKK